MGVTIVWIDRSALGKICWNYSSIQEWLKDKMEERNIYYMFVIFCSLGYLNKKTSQTRSPFYRRGIQVHFDYYTQFAMMYSAYHSIDISFLNLMESIYLFSTYTNLKKVNPIILKNTFKYITETISLSYKLNKFG